MDEFFSSFAKLTTTITAFKFVIFIMVMTGSLLIYLLIYLLRRQESIKDLSAFIKIFVLGGIFLLLAALILVMFHEPENKIYLEVENLKTSLTSDETLLNIKVYNNNNLSPVQGSNEGPYHRTSFIVRNNARITINIALSGLLSGFLDATTKAEGHSTQEYGP